MLTLLQCEPDWHDNSSINLCSDRHLNSDEWQYIANGTVEIGNFLEDGTTVIDTYKTGAQTACCHCAACACKVRP